jgi:hypothetical protein
MEEGEPDPLWCRALADEQMARQRLAYELLLELIGFGMTDEVSYYEHRQLLIQLQRKASKLADMRAFHDCSPLSLAAELDDIAAAIVAVENAGTVDLARCWYMHRGHAAPAAKIAGTSPGRVLSSQRVRLRKLLPQASPTERLALGISYERLYSRLSRAVHFAAEPIPDDSDAVLSHGGGDVSVEDLRSGTIIVARLGVLSLNHLLERAGLTGGATCRLQREALAEQREDPHAGLLLDHLDGGVPVGDFALVGRRLVEVAERGENDFGHVRYRVVYVAERPRADISEEWWPASEVYNLFAHEQVEGWFEELLAAAPDNLRPVIEERGLRSFMAEAWQASLREEVFAQLDG